MERDAKSVASREPVGEAPAPSRRAEEAAAPARREPRVYSTGASPSPSARVENLDSSAGEPLLPRGWERFHVGELDEFGLASGEKRECRDRPGICLASSPHTAAFFSSPEVESLCEIEREGCCTASGFVVHAIVERRIPEDSHASSAVQTDESRPAFPKAQHRSVQTPSDCSPVGDSSPSRKLRLEAEAAAKELGCDLSDLNSTLQALERQLGSRATELLRHRAEKRLSAFLDKTHQGRGRGGAASCGGVGEEEVSDTPRIFISLQRASASKGPPEKNEFSLDAREMEKLAWTNPVSAEEEALTPAAFGGVQDSAASSAAAIDSLEASGGEGGDFCKSQNLRNAAGGGSSALRVDCASLRFDFSGRLRSDVFGLQRATDFVAAVWECLCCGGEGGGAVDGGEGATTFSECSEFVSSRWLRKVASTVSEILSCAEDKNSALSAADAARLAQLTEGWRSERQSALRFHGGLHHHGEEPLSAGYTPREALHLSQSALPAQRAFALKTLAQIILVARSVAVYPASLRLPFAAEAAADSEGAAFASAREEVGVASWLAEVRPLLRPSENLSAGFGLGLARVWTLLTADLQLELRLCGALLADQFVVYQTAAEALANAWLPSQVTLSPLRLSAAQTPERWKPPDGRPNSQDAGEGDAGLGSSPLFLSQPAQRLLAFLAEKGASLATEKQTRSLRTRSAEALEASAAAGAASSFCAPSLQYQNLLPATADPSCSFAEPPSAWPLGGLDFLEDKTRSAAQLFGGGGVSLAEARVSCAETGGGVRWQPLLRRLLNELASPVFSRGIPDEASFRGAALKSSSLVEEAGLGEEDEEVEAASVGESFSRHPQASASAFAQLLRRLPELLARSWLLPALEQKLLRLASGFALQSALHTQALLSRAPLREALLRLAERLLLGGAFCQGKENLGKEKKPQADAPSQAAEAELLLQFLLFLRVVLMRRLGDGDSVDLLVKGSCEKGKESCVIPLLLQTLAKVVREPRALLLARRRGKLDEGEEAFKSEREEAFKSERKEEALSSSCAVCGSSLLDTTPNEALLRTAAATAAVKVLRLIDCRDTREEEFAVAAAGAGPWIPAAAQFLRDFSRKLNGFGEALLLAKLQNPADPPLFCCDARRRRVWEVFVIEGELARALLLWLGDALSPENLSASLLVEAAFALLRAVSAARLFQPVAAARVAEAALVFCRRNSEAVKRMLEAAAIAEESSSCGEGAAARGEGSLAFDGWARRVAPVLVWAMETRGGGDLSAEEEPFLEAALSRLRVLMGDEAAGEEPKMETVAQGLARYLSETGWLLTARCCSAQQKRASPAGLLCSASFVPLTSEAFSLEAELALRAARGAAAFTCQRLLEASSDAELRSFTGSLATQRELSQTLAAADPRVVEALLAETALLIEALNFAASSLAVVLRRKELCERAAPSADSPHEQQFFFSLDTFSKLEKMAAEVGASASRFLHKMHQALQRRQSEGFSEKELVPDLSSEEAPFFHAAAASASAAPSAPQALFAKLVVAAFDISEMTRALGAAQASPSLLPCSAFFRQWTLCLSAVENAETLRAAFAALYRRLEARGEAGCGVLRCTCEECRWRRRKGDSDCFEKGAACACGNVLFKADAAAGVCVWEAAAQVLSACVDAEPWKEASVHASHAALAMAASRAASQGASRAFLSGDFEFWLQQSSRSTPSSAREGEQAAAVSAETLCGGREPLFFGAVDALAGLPLLALFLRDSETVHAHSAKRAVQLTRSAGRLAVFAGDGEVKKTLSSCLLTPDSLVAAFARLALDLKRRSRKADVANAGQPKEEEEREMENEAAGDCDSRETKRVEWAIIEAFLLQPLGAKAERHSPATPLCLSVCCQAAAEFWARGASALLECLHGGPAGEPLLLAVLLFLASPLAPREARLVVWADSAALSLLNKNSRLSGAEALDGGGVFQVATPTGDWINASAPLSRKALRLLLAGADDGLAPLEEPILRLQRRHCESATGNEAQGLAALAAQLAVASSKERK